MTSYDNYLVANPEPGEGCSGQGKTLSLSKGPGWGASPYYPLHPQVVNKWAVGYIKKVELFEAPLFSLTTIAYQTRIFL